MADIKAYKPSAHSMGAGQVLHAPYPFGKARLIVREMTDLLALDLVDKGKVTDQLMLSIGYDIENLKDPERLKAYQGPVTTDGYGRTVPKAVSGSTNLGRLTSSSKHLLEAMTALFDRIVDPGLLVRRVALSAGRVVDEAEAARATTIEQLDLFTDYEALKALKAQEDAELAKERRLQQTILSIKKKYGGNALLKGMNLEAGATTQERNKQIGGHRA